MSKKIQLQAGKRYVLRNGCITNPLVLDQSGTSLAPFSSYVAMINATLHWPAGGRWLLEQHDYDIISEYADHKEIDDHAAERSFAHQVDDVLAMVGDMLKAKNKAYGNSALDPIRVFSKADPIEQLNVRIDDKLSRIMRGSESGEDVDLDLIGYLVIRRIAKQPKP